VKFTISLVYSKLNNGASLKIFGIPLPVAEQEVVLSIPTSPYYAGCTASSEYTDNSWSCDKGLVGTMANSG
jgi:hypothetical protein